ncbi:hypothetical protein [Acinetobacter higginsii]|uniref:hypothetical protein n=1 Tax=Acinetobacter higginsii TaxID=70347 RepID=UPI001F4BAD39|nr:hypothetical protein [Acinetobacter higginsii]MCH7340308.1 hypothetical protein [Acinetobacter higginsii]
MADTSLTMTIITSLLSGGLVILVAGAYSFYREHKLKSNLRSLIYVEMFLLYKHLGEIIKFQNDDKEDDAFTTQAVLSLNQHVFNNSKIQETLVDIGPAEAINIIQFYNFYKSIESKLIIYSEHLSAKINLVKDYNGKHTIKSYEELLKISTTNILEDVKLLSSSYKIVYDSKKFNEVKTKYQLDDYAPII